MAKKIVTLYIDDANIRILATQGKRIRDWIDSPLEAGLVQNGVIIKEADIVTKIQQLFKDNKINKGNVLLGLSGVGCLSRLFVFPTLPKEMLGEAVIREAKRVLPLPIEQLYLSWQVIPAPEGKTQVFLIAIPRRTFDTLFRVLRQAGLKVNFVNVKPLLLARMMGVARGVIVDVQAAEFDIVVISEGIPQPFRTIAFSSPTLPWQEKLTVIGSELDRTIKFFNSTTSEKPLTPSVPIFASGDLVNDAESYQALSKASGHAILPLPLSIPMECPMGFDANRHMVNISLALRKLFFRKEDAASVVNINVLPASYQPKNISLVNILALPSAIILAGSIVFLVMLIRSTPADIDSVRNRLNTTEQLYQQELSQATELTGNITELEKETTETETSLNKLTTALGSLERQTTGINRGLEVSMSVLKPAISLETIRYAADYLNITGQAPSEAELLFYLNSLNASSRFGDITIGNMTRIEGEGFDFNLVGSPEQQSIGISAIEVIINSLPTDTSLTWVNQTNGEFTVNGTAPDEDKVLLYLYRLETSGRFAEVISTNVTRSNDGKMGFSLVLRTIETTIEINRVLYLPMDEGSGSITNDGSLNGNDGTIYGATWVGGIKGYALSFDGVDDYVSCGNDASLEIIDKFTLEAMVKLNLGSGMMIVSKDRYDDGGWYLYVLPDGTIRLVVSEDGTTIAYLTTADTIKSGEWYHLAGVYDGTSLKIFINGAEKTGTLTGTVPSSIHNSTVDLNIGRREPGWNYTDGLIDEVMVYNRALSASEVMADYISIISGE